MALNLLQVSDPLLYTMLPTKLEHIPTVVFERGTYFQVWLSTSQCASRSVDSTILPQLYTILIRVGFAFFGNFEEHLTRPILLNVGIEVPACSLTGVKTR